MSLRYLYHKSSCNQNKTSPSHNENVNIILVTRKKLKNRKKQNVFIQAQQPRVASRLSRFSKYKEKGSITRHSSMPELNECTRFNPPRNRSGHGKDTIQNKYKLSPFYSKFIVNVVSEHRFDERLNPFYYPRQTKFIIYRCEAGGAEDNCCCSCNSDAMFEIMRSLYECYKKRDCRDCTCILCSHLPKDKPKFSQKEILLREKAMKGEPLPEGKTKSEIKLIIKVRTDLGLPVEPKTKEIRDKHEEAAKAGKLLPLEGKTHEEKEKILEDLFDMGIPLPKGRTPSEKALIAEVSGITPSKASESMALALKAKAEGLLTPLKGKTPEQREKILKGLAMLGLPLPEGQSPSENDLINKVRTDLGLPIEPTTKEIRDKHVKAAGKLLPLEGKTPAQKEKILKDLHNMDIPLPVGRTPSEKSLIAKIAASSRSPSKASSATLSPSEQMRIAKAEGLMTSLKGKTPKQREKILKGLAMKGLPLPEPQSPSEKKLIKKVRTDLGVPVEPKNKAIRDKHEKAAKAGKLLPLEGKSPAKKEKILRDLHNMGIPLPVGRTPSEESLIAKIAASPRSPSKASSAALTPSEKMRRAKAEGLLTSLKGKTPEQKEKIVKGLAMKGLPLPEAQSPSEKKLIDKVRADLGLPKEPDTKSMKDKYEQAAKAGLLQPLEGLAPEDKEKTLKGLHDLGIPLPEGRTPSEKALVAKIKSTPRAGSIKTAGIMTPLADKTPAVKEKILRARAKKGILLPEGTTPSEKKIIDKVRADLGLPKEPDTKSMKAKHKEAAKAGLLEPLEGKTPAQKEAQLKGLRDMGIPLPEGRTQSEKDLIAKVNYKPRSMVSPSEQLRRAKAEGLITPLAGKTPAQKEKILKGLAMKGIPLPEGKSPSEKKLIDKVRHDLGLPKEPDTKSMKEKYEQAAKAGLLQPLVGKTPEEKKRILQGLHDLGIPLPKGRTPSEKALIGKVKESPRSIVALSEKLRRAKAEGLLTPLKGKTPEQKEKIVKGLAMKGLPLPEAQSPSEKKLIDKIRADLGLPKDPTTKSMKEKHEQAAKAGLLQPLEGKTPAEKEKVLKGLRDLGIPLPEGRTPSEKALIDKVKAASRSIIALSEQLRRAKAEGLLTPLKGKSPDQKEKILKGLAMKGLPLPEAQSPSEKKLIDKVRADLGLPKDPTTKSMKEKHEQAAKAGLLQPLEGKTPAEKEKVLKGLRDLGIPLPEGRTPSEKALIDKVKAASRSIIALSEQLRRAKAEGLLTPLKGKSPDQKEKILKGLAMKGLPLPEAQSPSEKKLIDKVRADLGLPKDPTTKSMKEKHEQAAKAGLLQPLEGKTPAEKEKVLKGLRDLGIPLPEGRTPSEKALIDKVKAASRSIIALSEQLRRAKAEGLLTPLKGKSPDQKEKILKGLAMKGLPLPEAQSPSEKKLIDKVRADLGLPKDPTTKSMKEKHEQAAKAGLLQPLEGKTPAEKAKVLKGLRDLGIPLPEGRTPSEKALIQKVKESPRSVVALSEKLRKAKAEGLLTPLKGKTPEQKEKIVKGLAMKGLPLPEAQSPSEKKLIDKIRADLGLPKDPTTKSMKEKHEQAAKAGLLQPLEGKTPAEKEKVLKGLRDLGIPLPEGRTPSEKALIDKVKAASRSIIALSEQLRRAKAEGLLTPLKGKPPEQKEKILKGLAMKGLPLPEAQSPSEKKIIDKVRADLGLPKDPTTISMKQKHEQAAKAGLLQPLEGKTPAEKAKVLKGLRDLGIPLPEGRTPSEKALIQKVKESPRSVVALSEKLRKAKAEGLLTPLKGKTPEQKEKIVKGLAMKGLPLPEAQSPSEKKLIDKIRADLGLPKDPTTKSMKEKHEQAAKAGLLQPLEGKTHAEKAKVLKGLRDLGIPLPEGRTPSEKSLIRKVKESPRSVVALSEKLRKAKAEGLLTPLKGKPPEEKEKILKGLAMNGIPLPEAQSPSEKKLIDKVRADLGLPKDPTTKSMKDKHEQAAKAGLLQPLEGKTPAEKENILKGLRDLGIPLPEGRTPSEKALIKKVKESPRSVVALSEKLRRAKAEGLLTPLKGKPPEEKEKILKGLAMKGIPLPEAQSPSEKKLIDKVRADLGLPKDPTTKSMKDKHEQAAKAGLLEPLEGKTPAEKAKVLKGLRNLGIPLPEGRTPSEKALIQKVKESPRSVVALSEKLRRAKAEGLLTPLKGKPPEEKEKILKKLAMNGIPLPEAQSPSEKKLIDKVRADLGLPKDPTTKSMKEKHEQAAKAGLLEPLEGKTSAEKAKVLKGLRDLGIPLPEGRTPSEKALIQKVKESPRSVVALSEKLRRAKAEGLLTPLKGKTPEEKEKILNGLAMKGIPLPEAQSPSEKKIIDKVRADLGLPKDPTTMSMKEKHEQAAKAGLLQPLEGKTPAEKAKVLKGLRDLGIPLPEGRTPSEKALIRKVKESPRSVVALSEKLRRAKAEGLLTPLEGKPPEEKEKILKGLAMKGIPLPEAQSPSEKKLIDKVRADLGLPKDPTTKSMKEKHEQAAKAGLLEPLEGKTPAEKAKVLKGLRDLGIPLPEGRTPSEKALIRKVKESPRSVVALSEKLRRAKAEGLLTPLEGKPPEEKEKILKGLAMKGIPLPEAQSPSEKKLIDKVRADLGLPKDPTTKSMKEKHEQAAKAGLLEPLEGKTPAEKAKVLKGLRDLGIPLPEGRTPSEKALIRKVKESPRSVVALSEKLRRAKAEGLLTPLKGKPPEEKEKILKGLAMKGIPLPEAQSPSEKKLINKVRADLGLPKDPTTKSMKEKHEQAAKAGLLEPLEGKTTAEKAKVLKGLRDLGIPLPEGRTPSEKALIAKIKVSPRSVVAPSEQLRRAKAEGLLTPLKGKSQEEKEKIVKGLAMKGLPLPEAQSPSEKKLIDKVRANLGLPKDPTTKSMKEKHEQAAKAGLLQPLEGKTPAEKENILKGLRDLGIPLPEGRTPSEKALIAKVKASPVPSLAHSEQLRKAKAEGLLTPLKDKTPEEREKILKGLAMLGLPLPEGQSPSENDLINKVRTDLGLPIEPKTKAIRDKHNKAAKAGKLLPLEGKTPAQKEKILKGLHNMGIPLPVGRTPSEKSLIAKIAASPRRPSKASSLGLSPSEQMRRAKAEGLLTSLQGKTPEDKEKILKGLAMLGLPLPEGQSPSENKLINKVRTDLGLPIEPKTKEIRDKHEEAAKAGKLLPLEGKTPAQKEKILKGLHDMGIPLPIGRTASEKALIAKVMAGPVEKVFGMSPSTKQAAGIASEIEEIQKVTKCDRSCGCDKKKIRFKHSYIKIRVTSPDMSSFCDCPDECLPGIKGGVFIDNDGIQVTVGSAVGVPSLKTENYNHIPIEQSSSKKNYSHAHKGFKNLKDSKYKLSSFKARLQSNEEYYILNSSCSVVNSSTRPNRMESDNIYLHNITTPYEGKTSKSDRTVERCLQPLGDSDQNDRTSKIKSAASDHGSILVIKSEMSLCSTISNKTIDTVSLVSIMDSSILLSSTHYSGYQSTDDLRSSSLDESTSNDLTNCPATIKKSKKFWNIGAAIPKREYTVLRMSQTRLNFGNNEVRTIKLNSAEDPDVLINRLPSKLDVSKIINKIMSKKRFADASSIFVVVPMSEDEEEYSSSNCVDSMTSIHSIESDTILKDTIQVDPNPELKSYSFTKNNKNICGKGKKFFMKEVSSNETIPMFQNESIQVLQRIGMAKRQFCQVKGLNKIPGTLDVAVQDVGTAAIRIKSCCCQPNKYSDPVVDKNCSSIRHCTANVIPRQKGALFLQGCNHLPDIRTPSACSSDLHVKCDVFTQTAVGYRHITHKATSCSRLPYMRAPSLISLVQQCDKSCIVGSKQFSIGKSGRCRLSDMRTPSELSILQLRDCPSAMRSRILPRKIPECSRSPNMRTPSKGSLDLPCTVHVHKEPSVGSSHFPGGTHGCCYPRLVKTPSTELSEHLSDTMFSDSQASLDDFWSHFTNLGHNKHKYCEPSRPSIQNRYKEARTSYSVPCFSSKEHRMPMCNEDRSSPIQSELLKTVTVTPQRIRQELLSHTIKTKLSASTIKFKTDFKTEPDNLNSTNSGQHGANRHSYVTKNSPDEEDCVIEDIENTDIISDEISNRNLQIQTYKKSKMPIDSDREKYCLSKDIKSTNITTYEIPKQLLRLQSSQKSRIPIDLAREEYRLCEDIEGTDLIPIEILIKKPRIQASGKSKILTDSTNKDHCLCNDIEDTIIDKMLNRKPQLQTGGKSKMPIDSADRDQCLYDDVEGITERISRQLHFQADQKSKKINDYAINDFLNKDAVCPGITSDDTGIQQSRPQANQKSKMPGDFASKEYFVNDGVKHPGVITDELKEYLVQQPSKDFVVKGNCGCQQHLKKLTVIDYEYQQQSKNFATSIKVNCECQQQTDDSATRLNSECHQQSNKSAIKENSEYQQQSKNFVNNGFCARKEAQARKRLYITSLFQHPARLSSKHSQITKLISGIKKNIYNKINTKMASKVGEVEKNSKKNLKTLKISKNLQSHHSIQTMPEQIHQSQQMPPDAAKVPEVIYDGNPYEYNCGWMDIKEVMRLRSELTEITSGFKVSKKKKRFRTDETIFEKPEVEIELDFEEAIKYYAGKNLELFRDLIPQLETKKKSQKTKKKWQKAIKSIKTNTKKIKKLSRQKIFVNILMALFLL